MMKASTTPRLTAETRDDRLPVGPPLALGGWTLALAGVLPLDHKRKKNLGAELVQAGYYHRHALDNFLATRNTAIMGWWIFVAILIACFDLPPLSSAAAILLSAGTVFVFGVPRIVLSMQAEKRTQRIQNDLPDALDMITMMMTGGLSMEHSLERVIGEFRESHPALATELLIVSRQAADGFI